jgi:hypothetical protein
LADDEPRAVTLTPEQLRALANEQDPVKRKEKADRLIAEASVQSADASEQAQPQQDHQPYRPSNNPSATLEGHAPGGHTSHRVASRTHTATPTLPEMEQQRAQPHQRVDTIHAQSGVHDPSPQFIEARQRIDDAHEHSRSLHQEYFPPTANEISAKREGRQDGGGRDDPGGAGGPHHDGPTPPGSAPSSQSAKSLADYAQARSEDSSHRFGELDPDNSLSPPSSAAAETQQRQAVAEVETHQRERATYFEQRAEHSTPDQERQARTEQTDRRREQTDKAWEQEARRQERVEHMIAKRQADRVRERGGREE